MILPLRFEPTLSRGGYAAYGLAVVCALIFFYQQTPSGSSAACPYYLYYGVGAMHADFRKRIRERIQPESSDEVEDYVGAGFSSGILPPKRWEWTKRPWTLVTCTFLHNGWFHLLVNLLFLFIFGEVVNYRMGNRLFIATYLCGGVFSSLAQTLWPGYGAVLGASGAICAVMGLGLAFFPRRKVRIVLWNFIKLRRPQITDAPMWWLFVLWFVSNLLMAFISLELGVPLTIAYAAHLGGFVFGLSIGLALLATGVVKPEKDDLLSKLRGRFG